MSKLRYSGSSMFRQRIVASILSSKTLKIDKIREEDDDFVGLQDFEANFLQLIEAMTDGKEIHIGYIKSFYLIILVSFFRIAY